MHQIHAVTAVEAGSNHAPTTTAGVADFAAGDELPLVYHSGGYMHGNFCLLNYILYGAMGMCFDEFVYLILIFTAFVVAFLAITKSCVGEKFAAQGAVAEYALGCLCSDHIIIPSFASGYVASLQLDYQVYYTTSE